MKKTKDIVEDVLKQTDMSQLSVDKIADVPDQEPEIQTKLTAKQMADSMGITYIEPTRKMAPLGKLPEKLKKDHAHDWEYVKGVYENIDDVGATVEFWYCKYPGDPDCFWSIPANKPVFVPRMIAKHLEEVQKYHRFDYVNKNDPSLQHGDFSATFWPKETVYRGKFRPIEAFR